MISDLECAQACWATYSAPATLPVPSSDVYVRVTTASDGKTLIVAFRGSITVEDWIRDFAFAPIAVRAHPLLGRCHAGFLDAAESIVDAVAAAVGVRAYVLTGHSLGGAEALGVGGLLLATGRAAPAAIVTFGAPRFGMAPFAAALKSCAVRQYRRGNDIVPELPRDVPPVFAFVDARDPLIAVGVAELAFLRCHAIDGYVADVGAYLAARGQRATA